MSKVLAFTQAAKLVSPSIDGGLPEGLLLQLWIRRTGDAASQTIVELAGAKTRIVLGTGDRADVLRFSVITGKSGPELTIPGGLPRDRWVQVRAGIGPEGKGWIRVNGMAYAEGPLPAPGKEPRTLALGGFAGELAQLVVWKHPKPTNLSWDPPPLGSPQLWAYYPLEQTVADAGGKRHTSEDLGVNKRHLSGASALATVRHPAPLADGPAAYFNFAKDTAVTNLSPVTGMNGKLTLEAWVRLDTDEAQPGALVQLGAGSRRLVLAAGGKDGEIALMLVVGDTATRLCSAKGLVKKGQWTHIAATTRVDDTGLGIDSQVYFQGTPRAKGKTTLDPTKPAQFTALRTLLSSPVTSQCSLGGAAPGLARLRGGLAEVRIWRGVRPERLAQHWLTRVCGDEDGLLACYRLDSVTEGLFHDYGPRSGWGHAPSGVTLADTNGPPLPATTGAPYRLRTRGKLVRETVAGPKMSNKMLGLGGSQTKQLYGTTLVYDATVEVTTPAGDGASDRSLEVRIDRPLSAFVGPTEKGELKPWKADETQVVPLNGAGKVRLRFLADDLGCPTIRVRVAGAAGGVWTAIRPDAPVQQRLRTISSGDLTNPGPGRRNPLPAGTSSEDANALTDAFRRLATQFPAAAQAPAPAQITPQTKPNLKPTPRGFFGDLGDAIEDGVNAGAGAIEDGVNAGADAVQDGLNAGADAVQDGVNAGAGAAQDLWEGTTGGLEDAWYDTTDAIEGGWNATLGALDPAALGNKILATGSGVIAGAERAAKSAAGLIVRGVNELDALRKKVEGASRRAGTQAITALVDSAETLAVEVSQLTDTGMQWIEIIGTTIVDGAEAAWRVVVNGVEEAFAAMEALVKRIAAEIREILEFLAYLFMWDDFLAASDEVHALLDDSFQQLRAKTPQLGEYKAQLADALRKGVEQAVGQRSVGDLFGLDIDAARPVLEPLEYLLEKFSDALESVDAVFDLADDVTSGLGAPDAAVLNTASGLTGKLPDLTQVSTVLGTPLSQLLAQNGALADGSSSLLDVLFDGVVTRGVDAFDLAGKQFRARIKVPVLTDAIEATILGGRSFTVMRVVALVGAIVGVLTEKSTNKAQGKSNVSPTITPKSGVQPKSGQPQSNRDARRILWASMALGLVNSIVLTTKTALELAGKAAKQFSAILAATGGICTSLRGVLTLARLPSLPQKVRPYSGANAGLEIVTGAWTVLSAYVTYKVDDLWRPFDLVAFGLLGLATTTLSAVALGTGNLQGDSQIVTFSLRCGSWVSSSLMRLSEKYDDSDKSGRLKAVTVGLAVVSGVIDVAEAVYGNVDDVQQQVG
ncbi:hypothetical protein OV090_09925 [Nannocystis sp. RBIL2]|uniref:LamG-like jellyroll fold domain-containing protein n=1 Tax=Nannocystis sp. RBIL2 TaxID=2996788 RepID=UPI0022713FF3|nr:LamG-like jellyroll fold domain-containing protein [Nannocystis sp. RBIL2]MCY1065079.1 hypothetical protein [Nannocystis sp. RBIL2]